MTSRGRKRARGKVIKLPEGTAIVIKESEPMMVMVKQGLLVERSDPEFWSPLFLNLEAKVYAFGAKKLRELLPPQNLVASDHVREGREEQVGYPPQCNVEYYTVAPLMHTGFDLTELQYCNHKAYNRLKSTRVHHGDILIADSGVGGIGRLCFVSFNPAQFSCTGHLFVLRPQNIDGRFLTVFLKSRYGQAQIHRRKHGVGSPYLKSEDILEILVPIVKDSIQTMVNKQHRLIEKFHDKAIQAKKKKQFNKMRKSLQIAEGMLEALIAQVEWLIEGKIEGITPLLPEGVSQSLKEDFVEQYRQIGKKWEELDRERRGKEWRILGISTERCLEVTNAIQHLLKQVEDVMKGKRKEVEPVIEGGGE